jgi:hypothetical protein
VLGAYADRYGRQQALLRRRHVVDRGGRQYPQQRAADGDNHGHQGEFGKKYVVQRSSELYGMAA